MLHLLSLVSWTLIERMNICIITFDPLCFVLYNVFTIFTQGYSTSEVIYAIFDKGTNYCNLHNLVSGSGLTNTTRYGFKEVTHDSVCTQYSSADCSKY